MFSGVERPDPGLSLFIQPMSLTFSVERTKGVLVEELEEDMLPRSSHCLLEADLPHSHEGLFDIDSIEPAGDNPMAELTLYFQERSSWAVV